MKNLLELRCEIEKIRAAVDGIEVKGSGNRMLVTYAFEKCSESIKMIDQMLKDAEEVNKNEPANQ